MANILIKQGSHYHRMPPLTTLPWVGPPRIERYVTFGPGCEYDSAPYNADDVNKLFGLSFGFGGNHHNSARFGWRWSKSEQCIELLAYCYANGVRNQDAQLRFPVVAQVKLGKRVACRLGLHKQGMFYFTVRDENEKVLGMHLTDKVPVLPGFGLTAGPYFGGELTAPHDMTITLERV